MIRSNMSSNSSYAIEVQNLTKRYGDLMAVNDVSFTVNHGEVFAFLGPNGAGKTTTVEIIETLRTPTSGKVTLLGMDISKHKRRILPRIGVLPQGFNSFDRVTVRESILYFARLFGVDRHIVDDLIDLTHLRDKADVQFHQLSGGMKQRLGIAIALVNNPDIVFLDEPTTGLDPHARRDVWDILKGLKNKGKVVFLTTHYMEEAQLLADTVAIISKGKIVASGSPEQLIHDTASEMSLTLRTQNPAIRKLLSERNDPIDSDSGQHIKLLVKQSSDVHAILTAIKESGLTMPDIDVRKLNLEEVFLKLTGEGLGDSDVDRGDDQ